ncbi:hypothetical protein ACFFIF_07920 [Vagococcus entomophilus]|uniref:Uncharacterized protein n=1 Tax=Vagococcus entomophilus TaxID=1160095 RepID=A0A430AHD8_9ENTE|nr:hypothetical protein [Vagococcus entomophilus]RSU07308.1 hypothetical protein CBF30_08640 [Vagococcus entomophilus]
MNGFKEKAIYAGPIIFLGWWIYVAIEVTTFNFLSAFAFIVIVPILLFSIIVARIVNMVAPFQKRKNLILITASCIYSTFFYFIVNGLINETIVSTIVKNTNRISGNLEDMSISNISFNNDLSSIVMIFFIVLVFTKIFQVIFSRKMVK